MLAVCRLRLSYRHATAFVVPSRSGDSDSCTYSERHGMKVIALTKNKEAIVDDDDFIRVSQYKWRAQYKRGLWYARSCRKIIKSRNGKPTHLYLHRFILNAPAGSVIDHKSGNGLDNRKENLRFCTYTQNQANSRLRKDGYRGVSFLSSRNKWQARIRHNTNWREYLVPTVALTIIAFLFALAITSWHIGQERYKPTCAKYGTRDGQCVKWSWHRR